MPFTIAGWNISKGNLEPKAKIWWQQNDGTAKKSGVFEHELDGSKTWDQNVADIEAKITDDEGVQ